MYEIGKIYTWQRQKGELAYLNGTDTMVTEGPIPALVQGVGIVQVWRTDSAVPEEFQSQYSAVLAGVGDLRPKNPPSGEQKILSLFEVLPTLVREKI